MMKAPVGGAKHRKILLSSLSFAAMAAVPAPPAQAQTAQPLTRAGTTISNTASASFDTGGGVLTVDSNRVEMRVDELLDVLVASNGSGDAATAPGATAQVLSFQVTNSGNGPEAFKLTAIGNVAGDDYDPAVNSVHIDSNGNGVYDPGTDALYPAGSEPLLQPETSMTIFIVATTPGTAGDGHRGIVKLAAAAKTGTGTPGTSFDGAGENGVDAVVGSTGAEADADRAFRVATANVELVKSAVVLDPYGTAQPVPGATITYTIVAKVTGNGSVKDLTITDPVPAATSYQPGTITLGGNPLTDADGDDAGRFKDGAVSVVLGTVPGGESRTITFRAKIN